MATATKKGGSKIFWIIGGLVVIAGGIGAYFLLRKPKQENNNNDDNNDFQNPLLSGDSGSGSGSGSVVTNYTFPFKTTEEGNKFRTWVNTNYPAYAKEIDLDVSGALNSYVEKAWKKYGSVYLSKNAGSNPSNSDIQTIVNSATGVKADASTLKNKNPDFVKKWAETIKNGRSAFVWSNQVYDTKRGEKVLDYNPLLYTMYSKVFGKVLRKSPSTKSEASSLVKDQDLGKPTSVAYADGYVWFYLPKSGRWIASINASRTKSSNFTGISDELEFLNFDNNLDLNL